MKKINYDKCSSIKISSPKEKTKYFFKYGTQRIKITPKEYKMFRINEDWDNIFLTLFTKYFKYIK